MKVALRDRAAEMAHKEQSLGIAITKAEQQDMVNGIRRQNLARIKTVTEVTGSTKTQKYDRIVEILESHTHDIKSILSTPTVD